ncbi:hypothetical protein GCM10022217_09450 [Chryseobacterium ginsenosidimutans]|uniref:hypothetical protein n=1 Tax=Chryseobacterium ginsenosidimutans TaxID=687846 RepID=UPI0031D5A910
MNKLSKIILFINLVFLFNCKDKAQKNNVQKAVNQKEINFDNVLKCSDYSYDEDYFVTADYGCTYNQNGNNYGNIIIYLLPKKKSEIADEQIENENNRVDGLSIEEYKREFKIILFLIDKKYLNYNKSGDSMYYHKSVYEQKAYVYDDKCHRWIFIGSIKIPDENQNQKEQVWRESIISRQIQNKLKNENCNNSKRIIDSIAGNKYFLVEEKDCDLNNDKFIDKIVVLGNNNDIDPQDPETRIAPILILLNKQNKKYKILTNENIYPNNFGDAFKRLVIKNQFFTIELSNEVPDSYISNKYITFKYNTENIVLHGYSEIIDWSDGKTDKVNYKSKNLELIKFSDFNSNTILEKINN